MADLISYMRGMFYHRLDIRMSASRDTYLEAWPGAIIRNSLLYTCANVDVKGKSSLLEVINTLSLSSSHPFYKNLAGGFPKGIVISLGAALQVYDRRKYVRKGEILSFSLLLAAKHSQYHKYYVEAIKSMCERGLGHPRIPFELIDIYEVHPSAGVCLIANGSSRKIGKLTMPVTFDDLRSKEKGVSRYSVVFETPVLLHENKQKRGIAQGYQWKLNAFPSFYQLVRSVAFRSVKLSVLYGETESAEVGEVMREMDAFLEGAGKPFLISADIKRRTVQGTPREDQEKPILFHGYTGELGFAGKADDYLPLLLFMQELGVGNDTIYGLGQYKVKI